MSSYYTDFPKLRLVRIRDCFTTPAEAMVEGTGFEPVQPVRAAVLQTGPINHSGTPPTIT